MLWIREHRAFAVVAFFGNGRSIVATQRAFRARFIIPMGLFEVYCLQRSTRDPSSPEDKHSERHRRNTGGHASESDAKLQKSTQSVHRQRRPSFDRCNFQKCMKKNLMR